MADILNQAMEYVLCVSPPRGLTCHIIKWVRWEKPPHGWVKLNTDGIVTGNPGLVGCGGLLRDEHDTWLARFTRSIGTTTSFVAKLWGLRDGFSLCCDLKITSLIVELDAKAVVDHFRNPNYENNIISPILDDCRQLMVQF